MEKQKKSDTLYASKTALIYGVFYAILEPMIGIHVALNYSS